MVTRAERRISLLDLSLRIQKEEPSFFASSRGRSVLLLRIQDDYTCSLSSIPALSPNALSNSTSGHQLPFLHRIDNPPHHHLSILSTLSTFQLAGQRRQLPSTLSTLGLGSGPRGPSGRGRTSSALGRFSRAFSPAECEPRMGEVRPIPDSRTWERHLLLPGQILGDLWGGKMRTKAGWIQTLRWRMGVIVGREWRVNEGADVLGVVEELGGCSVVVS